MDDPQTDPEESAGGADAEEAVSLTTAFELLAREPRRRLLYWLHQGDDRTVSLDALVRRLNECDVDPAEPYEVRVALHHVHLPKLDDADVVEYDQEHREVRYRGDPRLCDLLEWGLREEALD